ncbi:MAG: bifunctional 5,10-methylenetetrahydrofolate dehydrogenase/5,10-methenyltetrahydrofolate cyclohydrolase [Candidatus Nomurabacteria bacterium]|nr:bifunctional 5,10-methylenetetrahydrofolate dehydrogenase/5,10-methenyltetrahydrofolate cyclohydrolase [Candidatus Nomurabacteria bacterium]
MEIINGRTIRDEILTNIKKEVSLLDFTPVFCDVLVGEDPVSMQYVRMKNKTAESVGIKFHNAIFPENISMEDLIQEIEKLNHLENICGIIVQLPLPKHFDVKQILNSIDPNLDVDCLGEETKEKFYKGETNLASPAALACMNILDSLNLDNNLSATLKTRKIVVLGQGELVGKPVTALLKFRNLAPEILTIQSENKEEAVMQADIIISGMGNGKYINSSMIKQGVIIIDAGTTEENGGVVGDVDFESVKDMSGFISPVPGGVGPVTVACLLNNVLEVAKHLTPALSLEKEREN